MKLLIAEDEFLCRENLKNIDWQAIGAEICAVAENGEEALSLARDTRPDIIISDIEMPKKNGLELANDISDILPDTKIIILTAYTKFEYVQESVSLGICEYILKPFEDITLINAVSTAIKEIEAERSKTLRLENVSRQLESCKYFLRSYFFNSAGTDFAADSELFSVFGTLDPGAKYTAAVISLDTPKAKDSFNTNYGLFLKVLKIVTKYHRDIVPFFDIYTMTFLFIHTADTPDSAANSEILGIMDSVSDFLSFSGDVRFVIGVGKCVDSLKDAAYSYSGAADALNYSFYLGFGTVICISDVEPQQNSADYFKFYDEGFLNHIKVGDYNSAMVSVKKLFNSFRSNREPISTVQRICNELFVRLSMCLIQCGQNPDNLFDKTNIWQLIKQYNTIDSLEKYISDIVDVTISHISFNRNNKNRDLTEDIQKYIKANPATSLNEIAEHFYHSPNYLSNIFSKETGETIKNYIIQVRIDISKKLLSETSASIYEIANAVGYKNPQHFSMVFKKTVGVMPSAYRNNSHKQHDNAE